MELKRSLTALDVFSISAGAMISSGIFILPGLAYAKAGPAVFLSYFISGIIALTTFLSTLELITAMPKAGGDYFIIMRGLGPAIGTIIGILSWLALSSKTAFALVGIAEFGKIFFNLNFHTVAISCAFIFTILNIIGIKEASRTQVFMVIFLISLMIIYVISGLPKIKVLNFDNFAPNGIVSIFTTAGFVFVAYGGLIKSLNIAEEVKNPKKDLPLGSLTAFSVVLFLYTIMSFVTVGIMDSEKLKNTLTPISDGALISLGEIGRIGLSIAAILAFVTTANAGIMSAARYPLALSRDKLIPSVFSKVHKKFKTPYVAILTTFIFIIFILLLKIESLVKVASTFVIVSYIFMNLSLIVIRASNLVNYRPTFKAPFFPVLQILGITGLIFLLFEMGNEVLIISSGLIVVALLVYLFFGRINANKESAFIHLIAKLTAKELQHRYIEEELKEIFKERENIKEDRFDKLVKSSLILDIEEKIDYRKLFKLVADEISKKFKISSKEIYRMFIEREKESSTVISHWVAIPHIVIEGRKQFILIVVRSRKGIYFSKKYPDVYAIFVLAGSKDERNFHLKSLAAIAQICQNSEFAKKWLKVRTSEDLRDLILLTERERF